MRILLTDAGKRFNRDWIFRHLTYEFSAGESYAIIGPNGSGKSTLLQVLSGALQLNEGDCQWVLNKKRCAPEAVYNHIAICAPYLELIEEMTLLEFLDFHQCFKPFLSSVSSSQLISVLGLEQAARKQIRYFSSGMKQRVKLAQAIFSDVPVVLLDEPCTNLDQDGVSLYHQLIQNYCPKRLVIVSSNDPHEYDFCKIKLPVTDWK